MPIYSPGFRAEGSLPIISVCSRIFSRSVARRPNYSPRPAELLLSRQVRRIFQQSRRT